MWFRKASARREAIRADMAEAESQVPSSQRTYGPVVFIAVVFFVLATAIQFWPGELMPYRVGDTAPMDLRSPVRFPVEDLQGTAQLREAAKLTAPAVLVLKRAALDQMYMQLLNLRQDARDVKTVEMLPVDVRTRFPGLTVTSLRDLNALDQSTFNLDVEALLYRAMPARPLVTGETAAELAARQTDDIQLLSGPSLDLTLEKRSRTDVLVLGTEEGRKKLRELVSAHVPQSLVEPLTSYMWNVNLPTFVSDDALTAQLAKRKAAQIVPPSRPVEVNQVIVASGSTISESQYHLLKLAQAAAEKQVAAEHPWAGLLARLGQALVIAVLTAAGAIYVARMRTPLITTKKGWALAGLMLLMLFIARGSVALLPHSVYMLGVAPTLLTAIILVIAFNQRFALSMGALHGLLVTVTLGQGVDFFLIMLTGVAVFCFGLNEIRTRGKLIEIGVFSSAAMFISAWGLGLSRLVVSIWNPWIVTSDMQTIGGHSLWTAAAGVLVAMFALAILPLVESIFKITTAMTLLELCDASKPLLRRLSQEAPGTFNHSLIVGILAEAAGNAIGANGLLCRVGAYYHDVGKLSKPQYFIENQTAGGPNRHEKLSPAMSLLIIVGHVKDGIELAREYRLPWVIHQFIAQHHGMTLVEYFYHAARRKQEQGGEDTVEVSETEFRYPGPRPQSRETAILMICDGCESIVRSIDEPTPGRIETAVHNLVMKRLMDGQFSECDLTLRDLSVIEETLVRTLAGVHHGRVAYPKGDDKPQEPAIKLA